MDAVRGARPARPARRAPALAGIGLAVLTACGVSGWRDASERLEASVAAARALGYAPPAGPFNDFGVFSAPGSTRATFALAGGGDYFVAAACSGACESLDFDVLGPDGAVVATDTGPGATPRLVLRPPADGGYTLVVRHGRCPEPRCRWVAQVYQRRP